MKDKIEGVIIKGVGGIYTVRSNDGAINLCQIRGNFRHLKKTPLAGDKVLIGPSGDPDVPFILEKILPRKNSLVRPPLANIDNLILVFSCSDPVPDLKLLDKMLIICKKLNIYPIIVFSKSDLDPEYNAQLVKTYSCAGIECYSTTKEDEIPKSIIEGKIEGKITALAGPSGVGKSTFCNKLLGSNEMLVGDISDRLKRGKHTTRHVELFEYENGYITDTPGFTSLNLFEVGVEYTDVVGGYPEMIRESEGCKFADCRHIAEIECNVTSQLGDVIDEGRYARYREFYEYLYSRRPNSAGGYK